MKSTYLIILFLITASASQRTTQLDRVYITIPGYQADIFSGALSINTFSKDTFHYLMFSSQRNPREDPLVLWVSGGPGCSSFLANHYQNGPYVFSEKTLYFKLNDYAWNKKANVLYFESPQGVGFSQGSDTTFDDEKTAQATYGALLQFYQRFPEYKGKNFYLSGYGYAGIYLTQLSKLIMTKMHKEVTLLT